MKTYLKNIMFTCLVALLAIGCTKDEIETFNGTDVIYFQWSVEGYSSDTVLFGSITDSLSVSFAFDLPTITDSIFRIPVKILGNTSSSDRSFKIEALATSEGVEGTDFILPTNLIIPANEVTGVVPVTLLRTAQMKTNPISVKIGLVPNENFGTDYFGTNETSDLSRNINYNAFEITISDMLTKPNFWSPFMDYYLGDFSAKKLVLYATLNNIPIPNWDVNPPSLGDFFGRKNVIKAYLIQQKNNGTPVLEVDGSEMKLGPFA